MTVQLLDYRALPADTTYDVVLSVEMIEAVGYDFWDEYFAILDRVTAPGGRVGIQAITMPHDRMLATRRTYTWINKYIFPGGLPAVGRGDRARSPSRLTGLRVVDRLSFGVALRRDAAPVGRALRGRARRGAAPSASTRRSSRMWHFYLEYSRAGFASGYIDVNQIVLAREEVR